MRSIPLFKVLVNDLDAAIDFYVGGLGMAVLEDRRLGDYRWLLVGFPDQPGFGINLDLPTNALERDLVGRQAGGQPLFSIATDDCIRDHAALSSIGVEFEGTPDIQPWGTSVVLKDPFGNRINLNQER